MTRPWQACFAERSAIAGTRGVRMNGVCAKKKHTCWKRDKEGKGHEEGMECDESRVARDVGIGFVYVYGPIRRGGRKMPLEDLGLVDLGHGLAVVHVHIVADMKRRRCVHR